MFQSHRWFVLEVFNTNEFGEWFDELTADEQEDGAYVVRLLEQDGLGLRHPYSSALAASKYAFRELRPKKGASPLRVIYAFDPRRDAVLILGGDKGSDAKFYRRIIKRAETIWKDYLAEQEQGLHKEEK